MGKTAEELDQLLKLVRDEDAATLRALERQLHSLLEEKERDEANQRQAKVARGTLSEQCSGVPIDPDLLNLVGIHPENPVQDDKAIIREAIARRMTD
jgi:vacuolar-type H+-ATPase subunit I/STV1